MKLFGSLSELIDLIFRLPGGKQVRINAASQTTAGTTVQVTIPDVAATGDNQNIILSNATQTMVNKTLTSPRIASVLTNNGISTVTLPTATTTLVGRDTTDTLTNKTIDGATIINSSVAVSSADLVDVLTPAFKLKLKSNSSPALTADRDLTFDLNNANRIVDIGGDVTFGGNFTTSGPFTKSGSHSTEIVTTGTTSVTLPTSGTLATLAGNESLSNKTLDSSNTINGASVSTSSLTVTGGTVDNVLMNRVRVEPAFAAISSGALAITRGIVHINAGEATLASITSAAFNPNIDGIALTLINKSGASVTINNSGNIRTGTNADFELKDGAAASLVYSSNQTKWILTGGAGGSGGLATSYITAGGITAVKATHYLTNLSASGQTVTLPSGVSGDVIRFSDAGEKWNVYPLTIAPASGQKINNLATNETLVCDVKGGWVELSYNSTYGAWALMTLASTSGSSSGSGEINAVLNASGASGTTGWTGVTQVSSGSPLDPVVTTGFSISNVAAAESSTSGGYYSITTMPSSLRSRKLKLEFYYSTPATDVYRVSVYAGSTRLPLNTDSSGVSTLPANVTGGFFSASFDATTASAYSVNITRTSGSTGAITVTNVVVGPGIVAQGAAVSDVQTWIPTTGLTLNATGKLDPVGKWRRVGSFMEGELQFRNGSGGAASGTLSIALPTGYTADTSAMSASGADPFYVVGEATYSGVTLASLYDRLGSVVYYAGALKLIKSGTTAFTAGADFGASTWVSLKFRIPIAEWAGNGTVNLGQGASVEYVAYEDTAATTAGTDYTTVAKYVRGANGAQLQNVNTATSDSDTSFLLTWQYPQQADDLIDLEYSDNAGASWIPMSSYYPRNIQNLARFGARLDIVSATQVRVRFANRGASPEGASSFGTTSGTAWNTSASSNLRWRVKKAKASSPVGFGMAGTDGSAGLYKAGQAPGSVTGTAIAAGYIGERLAPSTETYAVSVGSAGAIVNLTSMTLTPGVWLVTGMANMPVGTYSGFLYATLGISTASATIGVNNCREGLAQWTDVPNSASTHIKSVFRYMNVSSNTTIYLIARAGATSGSSTWVDCDGRSLQAIRIG